MHELIYFASPGYAEPTRFCLEISQVNWKNTTVDREGFLALKEQGELPYGLLPILKTPQGTLAESNALMRYAATLAGIEPEDLFVRGKVDEMIEIINNWRVHFTPTFYIENLDEKIAARQALFVEGGPIDAALRDLEKVIEASPTGWVIGTEDMTLADVKAFLNVFMMFSGQFDGIEKDMIQNYPGLLKYHAFMASDSRVEAYYGAQEDEFRWVFKSNAFSPKA